VGRSASVLDRLNLGLLSGGVALMLLGTLGWVGLQATMRALERERLGHVAQIEQFGERSARLEPLSAREQTSLNGTVDAFRKRIIVLGAHSNPEIVREVARLFESAGVSDVLVSVQRRTAGAEEGSSKTLEASRLDGQGAFLLEPHAARAQVRSSFEPLRRALDRLGEPNVPVQVDHVKLLRDQSGIRADIELVYWSRKDRL
jgi:hypothetical protein